MIGNACLHRWRDPQSLVDASEVEMHGAEGQSMPVILDLLAVRIGQSSEPPHPHPNL